MKVFSHLNHSISYLRAMNLQARIETIAAKKLVGKRMTMSLANYKTFELWQGFMQRRKEIENAVGTDKYSVKMYDPSYFNAFNPSKEFEKWATVEVTDFDAVPNGMEMFSLPSGLYAVFPYKGLASAASPTFEYIFRTWLPASNYDLDDRPHFEILGDKFNKDDPNSEEEIWVPIRAKE